MQKLQDASDRKRGDAYARKRESKSLSAVTGGVTTSKSPLLLVEGHVAALKHHVS